MGHRNTVLSFLVIGCLAVGCAADRHVPFDEAAFAPYAGSGTSTIMGQAFLKTRAGDVKYGAGDPVLLIPSTPFTEEDYTRAVLNNEKLRNPPPEVMRALAKYIRHTTADGSGNFEFKEVPAGEYFVECPIVWEVPAGYGTMNTGGTIDGVRDNRWGQLLTLDSAEKPLLFPPPRIDCILYYSSISGVTSRSHG